MKKLLLLILLLLICPLLVAGENVLFEKPKVVDRFGFGMEEVHLSFSNVEISIPYIHRESMYDEMGKYTIKERINIQIYPDVGVDGDEWLVWIPTEGKEGYFEIHISSLTLDELTNTKPVLKQKLMEKKLLILKEKGEG